eukprot:m.70932 g.70932  ORF g.70932 m.70932 type:complete len:500 (+) comp24288_c2_seq1:430-1929(+)
MLARLGWKRWGRQAPSRHNSAVAGGEPSRMSCSCFSWSCFSKKPSVNHVTVVIFLEFFAWGLVATILPESFQTFFGPDKMWLVLGLSQGVKGFFSFLAAPLIGTLSDIWGRRMFLTLTVASTCAPLAFLLLDNLWWHVIASALSGLFAVTFSISFAYCSDVTDDTSRSAAFGQVSATFAASMVISPAFGSLIQSLYGKHMVFAMSVVVSLLDIAYIVLFVPESMSVPVSERRKFKWSDVNPFTALKLLTSTRLMTQLSTIVFFSYLPEAGESQCIMLYLENQMHFSKADMSLFIALLGTLAIFAQTGVLGWLASNFSQKSVISFGLCFSIFQLLVFGVVASRRILFVNTAFVALGMITYPAVSAYVSNSAAPEEQGAVQGMITGVRSLCNGLGPALFGLLFQMGDTGESSFSTRLPFLMGAICVVFALCVNFAVDTTKSETMMKSGLPSTNLDVLAALTTTENNTSSPHKGHETHEQEHTPTTTTPITGKIIGELAHVD